MKLRMQHTVRRNFRALPERLEVAESGHETLSIIAMCVGNPDCLPAGIYC
jgi:hypothetical protein